MDKFFDIIKKLRPAVQSGKVSREAALRELIQESGVSEDIAETAIKNMVGAQPEVPGGITSLKPDVTFSSTQKELPEPIDMSVEERTGGMLKEGKDGEYTSTMNQESGAANVDPSIMSLGDEDAFKYEMALFRQNRQKKLEPIYKKYGAVSKEEKDFVDDFIGLDSEDRVELLKSDPKYKTSTTKLFIEDTVKNQPGIKQEELMEVVYGSTGEKILKERGLNDYIQYAKKEIEELGGSLNEDLLMRGLKDGFNDPEGFASGGRIGFKEGVGRKGILSALADKLNEIAPGSTGIGKTTKAISETAKRKRAEEEMFKNFAERNPIKEESIPEAPRQGKFTAAEVLLERLKNTLKNEKDPYVQETFPNFIKEIEANPKLAEDPKVQEAFGLRDLPENQRLVEYDDGTFDFFTKGQKRGLGSAEALADEFGISLEEAVKIQMMEPEDQVLEIQRRRRLNKRKLNASGGLNYLMGM